jgi:hypothetical protein
MILTYESLGMTAIIGTAAPGDVRQMSPPSTTAREPLVYRTVGYWSRFSSIAALSLLRHGHIGALAHTVTKWQHCKHILA